MSKKYRLDLGDVWSSARHAVFPVLGWGLTVLAERASEVVLFEDPATQALAAAVLAGAARLLQRLVRGPAGAQVG